METAAKRGGFIFIAQKQSNYSTLLSGFQTNIIRIIVV